MYLSLSYFIINSLTLQSMLLTREGRLVFPVSRRTNIDPNLVATITAVSGRQQPVLGALITSDRPNVRLQFYYNTERVRVRDQGLGFPWGMIPNEPSHQGNLHELGAIP